MATAEETADRRKAHAETRIDSVRDPWAKFLKAAEWLSSELKHQTLRDPKAGAESAQSLYEQTRQFADALNRQSRGGQ